MSSGTVTMQNANQREFSLLMHVWDSQWLCWELQVHKYGSNIINQDFHFTYGKQNFPPFLNDVFESIRTQVRLLLSIRLRRPQLSRLSLHTSLKTSDRQLLPKLSCKRENQNWRQCLVKCSLMPSTTIMLSTFSLIVLYLGCSLPTTSSWYVRSASESQFGIKVILSTIWSPSLHAWLTPPLFLDEWHVAIIKHLRLKEGHIPKQYR